MKGFDSSAFLGMTGATLHNYILPGLESRLIDGTVRVFVNTRESIGGITPHSHRFDFQCLVLRGSARNVLLTESEDGAEYNVSQMTYLLAPGEYETKNLGVRKFITSEACYQVGDWYGMTADQIHTIRFSSDAIILFIEGAAQTMESIYLEPFIDGETITTMRTESWMFRK